MGQRQDTKYDKQGNPIWTGLHGDEKYGKTFAAPGKPNKKALAKLKARQDDASKSVPLQPSIIYHMPGQMRKPR